jgi:hypothetical protein
MGALDNTKAICLEIFINSCRSDSIFDGDLTMYEQKGNSRRFAAICDLKYAI